MDTAFVIGNGESRAIFPIEHLKGNGDIWGCNAIYRDYPKLCDNNTDPPNMLGSGTTIDPLDPYNSM